MPSRLVSLVLLVYWCVAAFCLLTWEVLPEFSLGYPPDLRAIASAGSAELPARWSIEVINDPKHPETGREIGTAVTSSNRRDDGWFELTNQVNFDTGGLLQSTSFATKAGMRLVLNSHYLVEPSGNLRSFVMKISPEYSDESLFTVEGKLKGDTMEVVSKGPIPVLNQTMKYLYEPRSVVHDGLGPLDRLPGLHVGQRWDTRVVNPLSGQVDRVRVEVLGRTLIHWNGEPISAFEVVQRSTGIEGRTWVRPDGLILRQEVPFLIARLAFKRIPEETGKEQGGILSP